MLNHIQNNLNYQYGGGIRFGINMGRTFLRKSHGIQFGDPCGILSMKPRMKLRRGLTMDGRKKD
jgi:hypothetical protein